MPRVIVEPSARVPIRVWARTISDETLRQLVRIARQPYVVEHVAAMADAHVSESVAVGTVFATERAIVPAALGGDLGCGMSAIRIADHAHVDRSTLVALVEKWIETIPTGHATHRGRGVEVPEDLRNAPLSTRSLEHSRDALAPRHLGTLGSGNHFIELDLDLEQGLWLLVHSGSRGLGAAIAEHHLRAARSDSVDSLPSLDVESEGGVSYLQDFELALSFARANRQRLAARAMSVLSDVLGIPLDPTETIDIHHNFVAKERWFGRDLFVHRKGALAVPEGTPALIPGSMGTASYVVEGLGNEAAFGSCSHGAGRVLARKEARAAIPPEALREAMRRVAFPQHLARSLVEEAPAAYRDIREVLEDQEDLVRRRARLEPIAVLKG